MRAWFYRVMMLALTGICAVGAALPAMAQDWREYDLRSASFRAPADWQISYSVRDQEYDFVSPDGRYQLWVRWWMPDEPLLGFPDIVSHEIRPLAGQQALAIRIESGGERMLELAFPERDDEGEMFLLQLIGTDAPLAEHQAWIEDLLAGLVLNGQPALAAAAVLAPPPPPPPALMAPEVGQNAQPPVGSAETGRYHDPSGAFSLPLPPGWQAYATQAAGLRQVSLLAPGRDALVLAAVAMPDAGMTAGQVRDEFLGLLYRDAVIVKSIEAEAYPEIAGAPVHGVETIAKVYAINSIAMPFARGRVWIYQGGGADAPFVLVTIRAPDADAGLTAQLQDIVAGFLPWGQSGGAPPVATPEQAPLAPPVLRDGVIFDGTSLAGLQGFGLNGADFATQAKLADHALVIGWPKDSGWARAGIATTAAVVGLPDRSATQITRIALGLDAEATTGLTLALTQLADAGKDPETAYSYRFQLLNDGEGGGKLLMNTSQPEQKAEARVPWPSGDAGLELWLRPDQVVELRNQAGVQLAEFGVNAEFGGLDLALQAYLQVNAKNRAANLVLKRIVVDHPPFDPPVAVDALAQAATSAVLFDGQALGQIWAPAARREGDFARVAQLTDGALTLGWAADAPAAYAGIAAAQPVLWLDGLQGGGQQRVEFTLDGAKSADFEISLAPRFTLAGNLTSNGAYVLRFTRQPDGTWQALSHLRGYERLGLVQTGLVAIPDRLALVLTEGGVSTDIAGIRSEPLPFSALRDGAGLRISVLALDGADKSGALALRSIGRVVRPAPFQPPGPPDAGVAPLAQRLIFQGSLTPAWEGRSQGDAEFATLAQQQAGALRLARNEPETSWNRIALVSRAPEVALDERILQVPYDVSLHIVPSPDLGARLYLSNSAAKVEDTAQASLTLRVLRQGPDAGGLEVTLHTGHFSYDHWRRVLPASWWQAHWQGGVRLRLFDGAIAVLLDNQIVMAGLSDRIHRGNQFYLALTPGGIGRTDGGMVDLQSVSLGWVTPPEMTARQAIALRDTADFDAAAYLDQLNAEIRGTSN